MCISDNKTTALARHTSHFHSIYHPDFCCCVRVWYLNKSVFGVNKMKREFSFKAGMNERKYSIFFYEIYEFFFWQRTHLILDKWHKLFSSVLSFRGHSEFRCEADSQWALMKIIISWYTQVSLLNRCWVAGFSSSIGS